MQQGLSSGTKQAISQTTGISTATLCDKLWLYLANLTKCAAISSIAI
jgi:hypothetical protein